MSEQHSKLEHLLRFPDEESASKFVQCAEEQGLSLQAYVYLAVTDRVRLQEKGLLEFVRKMEAVYDTCLSDGEEFSPVFHQEKKTLDRIFPVCPDRSVEDGHASDLIHGSLFKTDTGVVETRQNLAHGRRRRIE